MGLGDEKELLLRRLADATAGLSGRLSFCAGQYRAAVDNRDVYGLSLTTEPLQEHFQMFQQDLKGIGQIMTQLATVERMMGDAMYAEQQVER